MPRPEVDDFFNLLEGKEVRDPLTSLYPGREVELQAIFVYRQARQKIEWSGVAPRFVDASITSSALSSVLSQPGLTLSEYPLFSASGEQTNRWGWMRADAIYMSNDLRHKVMFEAKVDGFFTYAEWPPDGQLSRQLEYLGALKGEIKGLVLLSPKFNVDWYWERLSCAWKALTFRDRMFACVVTWEEVFGLHAS